MGQAAVKQPPSNREESFRTDMSVGDILRRTREHYDQSLEDIELALRIKSPQIAAIENNDLENLPGRVYAIGFVRSYSEYLGLDGDKMVKLFKSQGGARTNKPHLDFPVAASDSKLPPLWVVAMATILAVFILIGWWSNQSSDRAIVTEIPPVPDELQVELTDIQTGEPEQADLEITLDEALTLDSVIDVPEISDAQIQSPPAVATQKGILLTMVQNSWVEIKDSAGKPLVSRVLKAGDQYFVPDRADLTMSIGNAGGVKLQVDGQDLNFLGEQGQVMRGISLDAATLKSQYSAGQ